MTGAVAASRARLGLVALLFALAGLAWWSSAVRMAGMDGGPGTPPGALGWFLVVWVVMMAAMMLPSAAPTVAIYARMVRRSERTAPLVFAAGYLLTWAAGGLLAFVALELGRALLGPELAWDGAGRWVAGATLLAAAAYELTPYKDACLSRCRYPLGFLLGAWREGLAGALAMGARHGAWCAGCCWALMASLFALGAMSLVWMAFVAALIALEKTVTAGGRAVTGATAAILLVLGVAVIAAPASVPGLTVPGALAGP
jgi:predicted metal-binding membrane protein